MIAHSFFHLLLFVFLFCRLHYATQACSVIGAMHENRKTEPQFLGCKVQGQYKHCGTNIKT